MATFTYKDYANDHAQKAMTLPLAKFLRRFTNHILPQGFMRIRGYGLWSKPQKREARAHCRLLLGDPKISNADLNEAITPPEPDEGTVPRPEETSEGQLICPHCPKGMLYPLDEIAPGVRNALEPSVHHLRTRIDGLGYMLIHRCESGGSGSSNRANSQQSP